MKKPILWMVVGIVAACVLSTGTARAADVEEGFVSLFNGTDMTGWEGKPGFWSVEDGALTGVSTPEKPCKIHNYLMCRAGDFADFELRMSYRIVGGNSGVQFRSRELPEWNIAGYQADLEAGDRWSGCLYDVNTGRAAVSMRGEKTAIAEDGTKQITKVADSAELGKHVKKNDWNEYHIIAVGSKITLKINGVIMTQVTDNEKGKASRSGIVGFQLHPGPPMKVQFKDIRIKRLD